MMKWIKDLVDADHVLGKYLVTNASKGVTGTNLAYLTVTFQDKTGTMDGKLWDLKSDSEKTFAPGNILEVEGDVLNYRGNLQMKIISGSLVDAKNENVSSYIISAPIPVAELEQRLKVVLSSFKNKEIKLLVSTIINNHYDSFITHPAAVRNHHEYASGLLYHTLSMVNVADALAPLYPEVNRDLLIGGVLLHDVGKTIELSGPIIPRYTPVGKLIGHISLMGHEVMQTGQELEISEEVWMQLAHMVLSHHGKLEYGSPVAPLTREALLLSMIDDMDAKMAMVDKALVEVEEGEFTPRIFTLEDRTFYKAKKK